MRWPHEIPSGLLPAKPSKLCWKAAQVCAWLHRIWWSCGTSARGLRSTTGSKKTIAVTHRYLRLVESFATVLPETPELFPKWRELVLTYEVAGAKVHDARLVAMMSLYKVSRILTFNTADFTRYKDVEAVNPRTL